MFRIRTWIESHQQPSENGSPNSVREGKNPNANHQETINTLITQFQSLAPSTTAPQLPDLARVLSLNKKNAAFLLAIIALLTQLIKLKTLLHSEVLEDLFFATGEQALNNLVFLTNKAFVYRIQYPIRTNSINFLLHKITAHTTALTAVINKFNLSDKPTADSLLLLDQSEKNLEQAVHSYIKNLPLIMTMQGRENLEKRRKNFNCGILIFVVGLLYILPPVNGVMLLCAGIYIGLSLWCFLDAYEAHKRVKEEQTNQGFRYQNNFPLKPQKDTLQHLKEVQKLKAGKDLLRNNNLDKALRCFSQISESNKTVYTQAIYEYGNALLVRKQYTQAIHYFTKAGDLDSAQQAANFQLLSQVEAAEKNPNKQPPPSLFARFFRASSVNQHTKSLEPAIRGNTRLHPQLPGKPKTGHLPYH